MVLARRRQLAANSRRHHSLGSARAGRKAETVRLRRQRNLLLSGRWRDLITTFRRSLECDRIYACSTVIAVRSGCPPRRNLSLREAVGSAHGQGTGDRPMTSLLKVAAVVVPQWRLPCR